jgi:tRNA1(Val) A37 N6-methylase TrmN6
MYTSKDLSECFANLHMTLNKEIQIVNHEMARISEKVNVLDSNAQLVNDDLQNIHNTEIVVPKRLKRPVLS